MLAAPVVRAVSTLVRVVVPESVLDDPVDAAVESCDPEDVWSEPAAWWLPVPSAAWAAAWVPAAWWEPSASWCSSPSTSPAVDRPTSQHRS